MRKLVSLLRVMLVSPILLGVSWAQSIDENELVMKIRSYRLNLAGAAESARERFVASMSAELTNQAVSVSSAVVMKFYEGPVALGVIFFRDGYLTHQQQGQLKQISGTWAIVAKSYQNVTIRYVVLLDSTELVDSCRVGQKVSFIGQLVGGSQPDERWFDLPSNSYVSLRPDYPYWERDAVLTFFVTNAQVALETRILKCPRGHEYAPSAGYRFCPQDGLPVQ